MSRNFELMQQSGTRNEIAPVVAPTGPVSHNGSHRNGHQNATNLSVRLAREELLKLVQRIFLLQPSQRRRAVLFASVDPGDASTRLCADAAKTLAQNATGSVCLVDADVHSTSLPRILGAGNHCGLVDALRNGVAIRSLTQRLSPDNLSFLSFGTVDCNTSTLWIPDELKRRLADLLGEFEYLLINAPSVILDGTAAMWGPLVDGVVLVVEANSTHREVARKAKERLQAANVRLLGAVFNNRTFPIPPAVYSRL
jgi:protein-tyrosine kinase